MVLDGELFCTSPIPPGLAVEPPQKDIEKNIVGQSHSPLSVKKDSTRVDTVPKVFLDSIL